MEINLVLILTTTIGCFIGLFLMGSNYMSAEVRDKPTEKRENGFIFCIVLTIFCVVGLCFLFSLKGSTSSLGKPLHFKDFKKGEIYIVNKKLSEDGLAKISVLKIKDGVKIVDGLPNELDEGDKFLIEKDGNIVHLPTTQISSVKELK